MFYDFRTSGVELAESIHGRIFPFNLLFSQIFLTGIETQGRKCNDAGVGFVDVYVYEIKEPMKSSGVPGKPLKPEALRRKGFLEI